MVKWSVLAKNIFCGENFSPARAKSKVLIACKLDARFLILLVPAATENVHKSFKTVVNLRKTATQFRPRNPAELSSMSWLVK